MATPVTDTPDPVRDPGRPRVLPPGPFGTAAWVGSTGSSPFILTWTPLLPQRRQQRTSLRSGSGGGGQVSTSELPGPLRHFATQLDELRSGNMPDMDRVGRLLAELAADTEFFAPLIAEIPSGAPGDRWLIRPERGPRLVLVHRPEGVMGYTHSHRCWVGIAPVRGVETHQRWHAVRHQDGRADLRLADERALHRGDVATLVPPRDVHNHGHVPGTGPSPYSLILLGDDMLLFDREEYDPEQGTWRALAPGDPGRANR